VATAGAYVAGSRQLGPGRLHRDEGGHPGQRPDLRRRQRDFGQGKALRVAFIGAVMGLAVASLGLLGIGIFY
jgi:hypothetical protein